MEKAFFIIYVEDQDRSREFYEAVLGAKPIIDVPGMTEFRLTDSSSFSKGKRVKSLIESAD